MKKISGEIWSFYESLLSRGRKNYEPVLPANLPYQGQIEGPFDLILPDDLLDCIRVWASEHGGRRIYYFLTESIQGEDTDFELEISELNSKALRKLNKASENVLVGEDFSWAVFVDHEGVLHVAGPKELFLTLRDCDR